VQRDSLAKIASQGGEMRTSARADITSTSVMRRISDRPQMSAATPDLSRLGELARGLGLRQHRCLIYGTQEEQFAAALPYLIASFERGEKSLYVADENTAATVLDALRRAGTDVDRYLESGALIISGKQQTCLRHGRFDPDRWIGFMSEATREVSGRKLSGLKTILGEMTWVLGEGATPETLVEYEAKLNQFVRDHGVRVLCQYNRHRFSPELILGILRTHPIVVYGGIICKNPYYVPPEELLKPAQPAREVGRLLNNILERQRSLDQLRALAARLERVREEERTRVARELHDELGQALTAIKFEFTALLQNLLSDEEPVGRRSQTILKLLDEAFQSVRRIGTELRPAMLDDLGLVASIEWLAEEFLARTGIKAQVSLPGVDLILDQERAMALFRILQEALTNIARHANATQVSVRLAEEHGGLLLEVRDNGKGIDEELLDGTKSLGILGMRERALLLGGALTISGAPETGTTVSVLIPMQVT
jgi:signal transduction histidine kinase